MSELYGLRILFAQYGILYYRTIEVNKSFKVCCRLLMKNFQHYKGAPPSPISYLRFIENIFFTQNIFYVMHRRNCFSAIR